ncbi:hypothetical protein D915_000980 [Fasciola hepatica]|uniref:Uncharacterized protein n=1 Tax=Fasciola hepatica TaxID=6192 RepID=A0A4E0RL82_FASHE|nr:hypothetical protein D915_000980 [Fasciola hepatica]
MPESSDIGGDSVTKLRNISAGGDSTTHSSSNLGQRSGPDDDPNGTLDSKPAVSQFRSLCFETQWARAQAIRNQVTMILECCESKARRLYMQERLAST